MAAGTLRERTRRAARAELAAAAQALFAEQGFEATSVDQIAAAVGISRRSFFRYFASKDDLVVGKYELWADEMVAVLRARPATERAWPSLRRTFDTIVEYYADGNRREQVVALQGVVSGSPSLHAASLAVYDRMQDRLADVLVERGAATDRWRARALTGAAWSCLQAALSEALATDPAAFAGLLDDAMASLRPVAARR